LLTTIWFETPEDDTVGEYTIYLEPEETEALARSGELYTKDFTSTLISGDYYMHVSVRPYGFECAMPFHEDCSGEPIMYPCEAVISNFTAIVTDMTPHDEIPVLGTPRGISHFIDFDATNLWNC